MVAVIASLAPAGAAASPLANVRRIVVKIGSAILIDTATNDINRAWLRSIAADVAALKARGADVLIVSSGAIALGRRVLGLPSGILKLEESQAAAAVGQIDLAHAYREVLREHGLKTAQILITPQDSEERRRYLNARNTLETLLKVGAVPVVNENDTVATAEIRFGDNDRLAARVAAMIAADCLVLLSDIDGLYTGDPRRDPAATLVREVTEITPEIEAMAAPPPEKSESQVGSGGMVTKLIAARIALAAGCSMVITNGHAMSPLSALAEGAPSTWFRAASNPVLARKAWIATSLKTQGLLVIDDGAVEALRSGKSLLPAGVRDVSGRFERGDAVIVSDRTGRELARGLVAYSIEDARKIMGRKSDAIEALLGYRGRNEMIHRDDLVLTGLAERRTDKSEETR